MALASMKKFRVDISGENFHLPVEDRTEQLGLYTTRYIEAEGEQEAELVAIALIKQDPELRDLILNEESDPPRLFLDGMVELDSFDGLEVPGSGYTFYPET